MGKALRREGLGLLFISPWLLGFIAFGLYPTLASLYYSFTNYTGFGTPDITGLRNYVRMVQDPVFWKAIWNTLYLTGLGVPLSIVPGDF